MRLAEAGPQVRRGSPSKSSNPYAMFLDAGGDSDGSVAEPPVPAQKAVQKHRLGATSEVCT